MLKVLVGVAVTDEKERGNRYPLEEADGEEAFAMDRLVFLLSFAYPVIGTYEIHSLSHWRLY